MVFKAFEDGGMFQKHCEDWRLYIQSKVQWPIIQVGM